MRRLVFINILLSLLLVACSGGNDVDEKPVPHLPSLVHTNAVTVSGSPMSSGYYEFGLFFMKSQPGDNVLEFIPSNSYYYNINDYVTVSNGYVTNETYRTSTDTVTIDSLSLSDRAYVYAYSPFLRTDDEPDATVYSYYGGRLPFRLTGATNLLVSQEPTELRADLVSGSQLDLDIHLKHALTQYMFYIANNSESDTILVSQLRLLGLQKTRLLYSSLYLNTFTGKTIIDSSVVTNEFKVDIIPAIRLLPGEVSSQPVSMMFPSMTISDADYGKVALTMGNMTINGNIAINYADTIAMRCGEYEQDKSYAFIVGIKSNGGVNYDTDWVIQHWGSDYQTSDTSGTHYTSAAYYTIVPWQDITSVDTNMGGGDVRMGYLNTALWEEDVFYDKEVHLRKSSDHTVFLQKWSTVTENITIPKWKGSGSYGITDWDSESTDETVGK